MKLDKSLHLEELQQASWQLQNPMYCKEHIPEHQNNYTAS